MKMIDNKFLYTMAESVGLSRMAFYRRAQLEGMTPPLSTEEFQKVALIVAGSPRIDDGQRKAILKLVNSETTPTEKEHLPFFRTKESNQKTETTPTPTIIDFETVAAETATPARVLPDTKIEEKGFLRETKSVSNAQIVSPKPEKTETKSGLTYAQTAGNTIRKMNAFIKVLMFISMSGVSYTLFTVGCAFFSDPYIQIALGALSVWAAWAWEAALKAQTNTFMHQWIYKLWDGRGDFILACIVLLTMLAPNIYQGVVAAGKLASLASPIHIEDDGTGINNKLLKEKEAIAADYKRTREALKQEQETAALADPTVAKFADYERSERSTAAARRREADKYRNKGEKSNMNWCLHLAKQADKKAETWRAKKEQASAAVYASYAVRFTDLNQEEQAKKAQADNRYIGLLADHGKTESQLRAQSERQNEGIMWIGLIFLPVADFVVLLLVFFMVKYYYRTGQVDPTLKEYKVGEKSKLQQFLSGVLTPAWDTIFGVIMQVGYRYQAMAQASLDGAGAIQQLMKERAVVRHQKYQERIARRIEEMKKK